MVLKTTADDQEPHTDLDQLRGGLRGGLTTADTESNHVGGSEIKIPN